MILCCQILNSLLQFSAEVSFKHHYVLLFLYVHVSTALDLAMFVGGDTPVLTRVRFRHFFDLQFGLLALLFNGDPATMGHLPPLPFHPLHTGNGVTTHLCDEGGGSLCEQQVEELDQKCLRFLHIWIVHCANVETLTLGNVCSFRLFNEEQIVHFFGWRSCWSFSRRQSCSRFLCKMTNYKWKILKSNKNLNFSTFEK